MINPHYEISDEDMKAVIDYLKIYKPDKVNAKNAWEILSRLYSQLHVLDHIDPDAIRRIAEQLDI